MGYLSVLSLHIVDLFEVIVSFPEARGRLRWAQIQIATCRGVVRIATVIKDLVAQGKLNLAELTEGKRKKLIEKILEGEFDANRFEDHFGVEEVTRPSHIRGNTVRNTTGAENGRIRTAQTTDEVGTLMGQLANANRGSQLMKAPTASTESEDSGTTRSYHASLLQELVNAVHNIH